MGSAKSNSSETSTGSKKVRISHLAILMILHKIPNLIIYPRPISSVFLRLFPTQNNLLRCRRFFSIKLVSLALSLYLFLETIQWIDRLNGIILRKIVFLWIINTTNIQHLLWVLYGTKSSGVDFSACALVIKFKFWCTIVNGGFLNQRARFPSVQLAENKFSDWS